MEGTVGETKQQLDEMRDLFNKGLDIARKLNAPEDRIVAMHTAIGGLTDLAAYENNVKPRRFSASTTYAAARRWRPINGTALVGTLSILLDRVL